MIDFSFPLLRRLGLTPAMAQSLTTFAWSDPASGAATTARWMRATAIHRETVDVHDGEAAHSARCSTRLIRDLQSDNQELACGDWVLCAHDAHGQLWVHARISPLNHIVRRDGDGSRHTVVSNVDTALLVMGLDLDFNLQRLERYLALVVSSGVQPVVVLTKADIASQGSPDTVSQRVDQVRARVGAHMDVVAVDARSALARQVLAPYLGEGQTLVLLGSSGAGKSTLTNSLLEAATQDTGTVREHDSRASTPPPRARCTCCPPAPASSTRPACAPCART
jgi:ribosome biogenesis GTPase